MGTSTGWDTWYPFGGDSDPGSAGEDLIMLALAIALLVIALILFAFAAANLPSNVNLTAAGLFFMAAYFLLQTAGPAIHIVR